MKKEVSPVVIAAVLVVFALVVGGVFYMKSQSAGGARPADAGSQTKMIGGEPTPLGPAAGPPAGASTEQKSSTGAQ